MLTQLAPAWGILICLVTWVAAIKDLRTYTIPHIFPGIIIALFVVSLFFIEFSFGFLGWRLFSALIAFFVGFLMFAAGVMGGGDVKLFAALALFIPPRDLIVVVVLMTFLGLFYTMAVLIYRMIKPNPENENTAQPTGALGRIRELMRGRLPYGPAIALGITAYLWRIGF